ncbi:hypothetical protein V1512DRAFT_256126 [Lipomyces arxii]|uniref:uncharacterized protein n=1 Tax=Lipomyces arxii TaxID=56418 RepID=UPI0034CD4583
MSLRIIPSAPYSSSVPKPSVSSTQVPELANHILQGKPPAPITDSLNLSSEQSSHPLEAHLKNWDQTQFDLKMEGLRRLFGTHEPVKRVMELEACNASLPFYPEVLRRADVAICNGAPGARTDVAREILLGRDGIVDWEDVYGGNEDTPLDFHTDLERRMKM